MKISTFLCFLFSATVVMAQPETSLKLDGGNDYIDIPALNWPADTEMGITVEFWHNRPTVTDDDAMFGVKSNALTGDNRFFCNAATNGNYYFYYGNISTSVPFNKAAAENLNTWQHFAFTADPATDEIKFYLDGVLQTTNSVAGLNGPSGGFADMTIGRTEQWQKYVPGAIDEFRMWTYARSAEQIAGSMNCTMSNRAEGLFLSIPFEDGVAEGDNTALTTVTDVVGGHTANMMNMAGTGTNSNFSAGAPAVADECEETFIAPVPTMGEWALIVFGLIIMSMGVITVKRREELHNLQTT
jgi:hypothetical protein